MYFKDILSGDGQGRQTLPLEAYYFTSCNVFQFKSFQYVEFLIQGTVKKKVTKQLNFMDWYQLSITRCETFTNYE